MGGDACDEDMKIVGALHDPAEMFFITTHWQLRHNPNGAPKAALHDIFLLDAHEAARLLIKR